MNNPLEEKGAIAWMARNPVAANLLMAVLLLGGLLIGSRVKQEVFPDFDLDQVQIAVPYPGGSPAEVEQGIILSVEDEVRGLDGVKRVVSKAFEGGGIVSVELLRGTEPNKALQDIKNAVDRIATFPQDAERPVVSRISTRREVISLVVYGNQSERTLRQAAERIRDELLQDPGITLVELGGVRPLEISIDVPQATLRAHGLTLQDIAHVVSQTAIELPAGGVKTEGGEILLRTAERRDLGSEFEDISIISRTDGTELKLTDIATIVDGFADTDQAALWNGKPAAMVKVYRVGDQTPLEVAKIVKQYKARVEKSLPEGIGLSVWFDWSVIYVQRVNLLLRNAAIGLVLVLLLLGLFLELRLAFWVTMGIPISFLGALFFMPAMNVSVNMISLFAFILTLGIVVDDAIVVGENIYKLRQSGVPFLQAAIQGARQISVPVIFSVLTNMAAFAPMLFIPGVVGKFFWVIPAIVLPIFLISLMESLFILPAHLGHLGPARRHGLRGWVHRQQQRFSRFIEFCIVRIYEPFLKAALRARYFTTALALAVLTLVIAYTTSGRIPFVLRPKISIDLLTAKIVLPYGAPIEETRRVQALLVDAVQELVVDEHGQKIIKGIFTEIGGLGEDLGAMPGTVSAGGSHLATVIVSLVASEELKHPTEPEKIVTAWREQVGEVPGVESITYSHTIESGGGAAIDVQLSHQDMAVLQRAAADVARALEEFPGVHDIDDGFSLGKPQLDFKVKPAARSLGVTAAYLGREVRNAFYGAEAIRQQRGRDEVKVMVRLPEEERQSEYNVSNLLIRTPAGGEIELQEAARIVHGRADTEINRTDGRRVLDVTAEVIPEIADGQKVLASLRDEVMPEILARYPGLAYSFEGEQREIREALGSLTLGFAVAVVVIFAMLAIPLKSYIQPIIVMTAIPFGLVGAVIGHLIMGYELSMISMFGLVALSGVVVNDSLVLIHATNEKRGQGNSAFDAVAFAGGFRFRAIILTSVTTFGGLLPMIFEKSFQARFLIPMAISLGFGIMFATLITLLLVPCLYLIMNDIVRIRPRLRAMLFGALAGAAVFGGLFAAKHPFIIQYVGIARDIGKIIVVGVGFAAAGGLVGWSLAYLFGRKESDAASAEEDTS